MSFTEQFVQRGQNRIYTREYGGEEPAIMKAAAGKSVTAVVCTWASRCTRLRLN
jgi:hypothetical protein